MEEQRRMYVGSETGIVLLSGQGSQWIRQGITLAGKPVNVVAANRGGEVVYACVPREGVFATENGGKSWELVFPGKVHTLAVDPNDPQTVYAGTEPVGLFGSHDKGKTWTELEALQRVPEEVRDRWWFPIYPHESHVRSIFVDWHDPKIICIALEHGGIFRTVDGGNHWEDLSAGIEYLDIHMVMGDPLRENLYYAATARGFYRSEDHGRDWILSTDGVTRDYFHDFVVLPGPSPTLLVTTANGTPPAWLRPGHAQSTLFGSTDCGLTWRQLGSGLPESMERMIWSLSPDPENRNAVYACVGDYGPNLPRGEIGFGEVWMSADRGAGWTRIYEDRGPVRSVTVTVH